MTGEKIREIRRKLFMTQKEFSEKIGVHYMGIK